MIRMFRAGLAAALVLFAAPASAQEVSRLDRILQSGALRVGTTGDYKPFTYRDPATGALSGFDIDQAEALGRALGVTVEFVQTAWPTLMKDFEADRFDIAMGGVLVTLDRAKKGYFSVSYLRDGKTPITRCENVSRFQTVQDIDKPGVKAIVNPGGTNERFARGNLNAAEIVVFPDNTSDFRGDRGRQGGPDDDGLIRDALPAEAASGRAVRRPPGQALRLRRESLLDPARHAAQAVRRSVASS